MQDFLRLHTQSSQIDRLQNGLDKALSWHEPLPLRGGSSEVSDSPEENFKRSEPEDDELRYIDTNPRLDVSDFDSDSDAIENKRALARLHERLSLVEPLDVVHLGI